MQIYLYFCDDNENALNSQNLRLNLAENTEYVWLSLEQTLAMYQKQLMAIVEPQILILSLLKFNGYKSYKGLKQIA